MARVMRPEVGNFTLYPGVAIFPLETCPYRRNHLAHRPSASVSGPEAEPKLIGRSHERKCTGTAVRPPPGACGPIPANRFLSRKSNRHNRDGQFVRQKVGAVSERWKRHD